MTHRVYDTQQLYVEDTLLRIKCLESEINECAKRMNEIIRQLHEEDERDHPKRKPAGRVD